MREDPLPDADPNEKFYLVTVSKNLNLQETLLLFLLLMHVYLVFVLNLILYCRVITNIEIVVKLWNSRN